MNPAIWKKAIADAWAQLWISSALLLLFAWLFVWLMSRFAIGAWGTLLKLMPSFVEPIIGIPLDKVATPAGQISIIYVHVITLLVCVGWAVGRGSDSISGEIGRGTMDLILSLPVWRSTVMIVPALVATLGAAVLVASVWLGTWIGLSLVRMAEDVSVLQFLPGAVNLFCMVFCLTGITTFVSSWNRDRWRTISIATGFFVVSMIVKLVARMCPTIAIAAHAWPLGTWLKYGSFLTAFEPQWLILMRGETWRLSLQYGLSLVGLGLLAYTAAGIVLWRRDIPTAI